MKNYNMKLNLSKTRIMFIKEDNTWYNNMDQNQDRFVDKIKFLGVWIDANLDFAEQVKNIINKVKNGINFIKNILETLVN